MSALWKGIDVGNADLRECRLRALFASLLELAFDYGACYTTDDYQGVSIWRPPLHGMLPFSAYITNGWQMLNIFGVSGSWKAAWTMSALDERHMQQDPQHWYLQTIGTAPMFQGRGYGSALLHAHLRIVDEQGLPAYLEATTEQNARYYEKFGFRVIEEIKFSDTCTSWCMLRAAAGAAGMSVAVEGGKENE